MTYLAYFLWMPRMVNSIKNPCAWPLCCLHPLVFCSCFFFFFSPILTLYLDLMTGAFLSFWFQLKYHLPKEAFSNQPIKMTSMLFCPFILAYCLHRIDHRLTLFCCLTLPKETRSLPFRVSGESPSFRKMLSA